MIDPRQTVYLKNSSRKYLACGKMHDLSYDAFCSTGLWLHTETDGQRSMSLIAKLDELPSSAVAFGSVMRRKDELKDVLRAGKLDSISDLADRVLKWIAGRARK